MFSTIDKLIFGQLLNVAPGKLSFLQMGMLRDELPRKFRISAKATSVDQRISVVHYLLVKCTCSYSLPLGDLVSIYAERGSYLAFKSTKKYARIFRSSSQENESILEKQMRLSSNDCT